jgi:NAD(P)-dependent dehydrogenase (short-subunit alcohol dehydrogenase family)
VEEAREPAGEDMSASAKVVIVTGAARGIGQAICHRLSGDGWKVVCADVEEQENSETAGLISGEPVTCDVSKETDVENLVRIAATKYGRLDGIVSNAGINRYQPLADWTLAQWDRIIATNLTANFLLARAAEKHLRSAKGAMVLMASTRAHMSEPGTFAYSASKGGIVALTHSLAMSLQPDVRVNCVSPGWIDTGKHAIEPGDHEQHPVGRIGRPEDIAAAVAFLLDGEQSGFVTGQEMVVDGGMTRKMIYA